MQNILATDPTIDLENINTSTFGKALADQKFDQTVSNSLSNQNSTISRLNKRYTNQLLGSDSSIEDQNDQMGSIEADIYSIPLTIRDSVEIRHSQKESLESNMVDYMSKKVSKLKNLKHISCSSDENPMSVQKSTINMNKTITERQLKQLEKIRNQLLKRIVLRLIKNNEIIMLKTGYIAFLNRWILTK